MCAYLCIHPTQAIPQQGGFQSHLYGAPRRVGVGGGYAQVGGGGGGHYGSPPSDMMQSLGGGDALLFSPQQPGSGAGSGIMFSSPRQGSGAGAGVPPGLNLGGHAALSHIVLQQQQQQRQQQQQQQQQQEQRWNAQYLSDAAALSGGLSSLAFPAGGGGGSLTYGGGASMGRSLPGLRGQQTHYGSYTTGAAALSTHQQQAYLNHVIAYQVLNYITQGAVPTTSIRGFV